MAISLIVPAESVEAFCKMIAALIASTDQVSAVNVTLNIPLEDARHVLRTADPGIELRLHFHGKFKGDGFPQLTFGGSKKDETGR